MRMALYAASALVVMALAFWAYRENYSTQHALRDLHKVQDQIATLRAEIAMQKAEWAYENRPSRLQALAKANFASLKLLPMEPWQLSDGKNVAYRAPDAPAAPATTTATTAAASGKLALSGTQTVSGTSP